MGRPKREFDKNRFEMLCAIQCKKAEICREFETTYKTIDAWCKRTYGKKDFSTVYDEKKEKGKTAVRAAQFRLAQENPTMSIWWGKQYLGQTDSQVVNVTANDESIKAMGDFFADKKRNT